MTIEILKPFRFSVDGIATEQATDENASRIPSGLLGGLASGGFVRLTTSVPEPVVPTTDAVAPDGEEPGDDCPLSNSDLRDSIKSATGKVPGPRTSRTNLIEQFRALTKAG